MEVTRLGDFNPREVEVRVGSGNATVDFQGAWNPGDIPVRLHIGSGTTEVSIPQGVGFSVPGRIGSGYAHIAGQRYGDSEFEQSEQLDVARVRLRIVADVGSGDMRVRTKAAGLTDV